MDTILAINAFLETVNAGGFSSAARRLGVAPSVVMKRVNHLEHVTRSTLLHRTTREVRLTEVGQRSLDALRRATHDLDRVLAEMRRAEDSPMGHLRIGTPPALTALHLAKIFSEFARKHPRINIDVTLIDHPINPIDQGFDFVIGAFSESFADVLDIPLFPLRRLVCAAPAYFRRMGTPRVPKDLFAHNCLTLSPAGKVWELRGARGPIRIELKSSFTANDALVLGAAATAGHGVALLPSYVALPAIRTGQLEQALTAFPAIETWFKVFIPRRLADAASVNALLDFVRNQLSPRPPWERSGS